MGKPLIEEHTDSAEFLRFYYLKEEMTAFLRAHGLPTSGSKEILKNRIAEYLDCGFVRESVVATPLTVRKSAQLAIADSAVIGADFVCSQAARAYFIARLGKSFRFKVTFQRWLRDNPDATFADACEAFRALTQSSPTAEIGAQFEYNAYIRAFFNDNPGRSLSDAITCWNYRKDRPGDHSYSRADLVALCRAGL